MIFLYNAEPEHAEKWRALLAAQVPDLEFVEGFDAVEPARVTYLLTWKAVADIERYTSLRVLFAAGAGVDQFDLAKIPHRWRWCVWSTSPWRTSWPSSW